MLSMFEGSGAETTTTTTDKEGAGSVEMVGTDSKSESKDRS